MRGILCILLAALSVEVGVLPPVAKADYPPPSLTFTGVGGEANPGPKGLTVNWTTGDGTPAGVYRSVDGAPFTLVGYYGAFNSFPLTDVPADRPQRFEVREIGSTPKVLVRAVVEGGKGRVVSVSKPIPPRDTPRWLDRLLQLVPFALYAGFAVLLALYLRSLRGLRHAA